MTDEEVRQYLNQILGLTLVLDDGTRVKPIFIPWEELVPAQQTVAVNLIKEAAVDEMLARRGNRIRFEFNEIPEELEAALLDLVGGVNPDFEFVQVDLGSNDD